jgi:hypothetical protein
MEISSLRAGMAASPTIRKISVKIKGRVDMDLKKCGAFIGVALISVNLLCKVRAATVSPPVNVYGRMPEKSTFR